jgi:multidrug efflux pump subunit AcrA (membrane-fusion protein)
MKKTLFRMAVILMAATLVLTGCDIFGPGKGDGDKPTVTSVTVSPDTASVVKGRPQAFTATVQGTNSPVQTVTMIATGFAQVTFVNGKASAVFVLDED